MLPSSGGFKYCVAFVCALFATPAFAAEVETITLNYNPSEFVIESTGEYVEISHPKLGPALVDQEPVLPRHQLTFAAPDGMRLSSVVARGQVASTISLSAPVRAHDATPMLGIAKSSAAPPASAFKQSLARHSYGNYMRGTRVEFVEVSPVQWDASASLLKVYDSIELELTYEPDAGTPVTPRNVQWGKEDSFARAMSQLYFAGSELPPANGVNLQSNGMEPFSPRLRPSEDGSAVRYLIITDDVMAPEFQALADRKTALGFPAVVRTVSWIRANYDQGFDVAEDIRNFIIEAVANWGVEYVLLGGDPASVPIRYAKSYYFGGEDIPTDMYYQCLDGNWNADGDELFGEAYFSSSFPGDGVDLLPDVWVGRSPVRNAFEAKKAVEKMATYESSVPLGSSFSNQMLSLGEVLFPQNWTQGDTVIYDGATLAEQAVAIATPTMSAYRMYEDYMSFPGSVPEIKIDVVSQINAGYNLVLHVGHGFRNTMAVGIGGQSLTNFDADSFSNGSRTGLLYAINCTSSALDFDCIAEHFYRNTNGGFVSSVGSTRLDFPATGVNYQDEFFDLMFNQGMTRLGEVAASQKLAFVGPASSEGEHRWTQFNLIYLGDPSLDFHTGAVESFTVNVTGPIELGQNLVNVNVSNGQGPVDGATVTLHKAGDSYGTATTNASGDATVYFTADFPGKASIGVTAHDHLAYIDSVDVLPPSGVHLFTESIVFDDVLGGDGDGIPEAGETLDLYPSVGNQGQSLASAVSGTLLSVPTGLTLVDGTAAFPDVAPGATQAALDPWTISVDPTIADASQLLSFVSWDATAYNVVEDLLLYAGAPVVTHLETVVRDTVGNGNGNGSIEAFEDQHLSIILRNAGLGASTGLTATLNSSDGAVTILDGTSSYGDLEAGQSSGGDGFQFQFSDSNPTHLFDLTVSDFRGVILTKSFEVDGPSPPTNVIAIGGGNDITLTWTKSTSPDLFGYHIYRSSNVGGPFARVTTVPFDPVSYYRDEGLAPLTRFYYYVSAVDSSANIGPGSTVTEATTSLPTHAGFPLSISSSASSSPTIGYFSGDTKAEIITGGNEVIVALDNGDEYIDGDEDTQTYGVFSNTGSGPFWSPPSVGDLDGDGIPEIVSCGWQSAQLYVWDSKGEVKNGFPKNLNLDLLLSPTVWSAPALADIDNDGNLEIFINAGAYTFAFNHDGTELVDGDNDPGTDGVFNTMLSGANYGTPALADVDNDNELEVIVGSRDGHLYVNNKDGTSLPGFPFNAGGDITNSPAIGDLDNDGWKEIVFASSNFLVYALNVNLVQPPGWPAGANMNLDYDASPALADLDGDTYLDVIICAGNGTPYAFRGQNGWLFPGWGFILYDAGGAKVGLSSSPAIGNLDADPEYEICFGGNDGKLYAFNVDATLVDGFPIGTNNSIEGGPILWDIDDDGLTEVVAQSLDENVYVWDSPGSFDPNNQPWPMFHQNSRRTGEVNSEVWVTVGTPDLANPTGLALAPNHPNPFGSHTAITFRVPEGPPERTQLQVFDLGGRLVRTLFDGLATPGTHEVSFDGKNELGQRLGGGIYFYRLDTPGNSISRKLVLLP